MMVSGNIRTKIPEVLSCDRDARRIWFTCPNVPISSKEDHHEMYY